MDDQTPANESPPSQGLNKIDLTQLQAFTFGTQWSEVKNPGPGGRRERDFDRGERRDDGPGRGAPSRDRRSFRKPAGTPGAPSAPGAPRPAGGDEARGQRPSGGEAERRDRPTGERRDRPPGGPEGFRGGPRRDFRPGGPGGERRDFRPGGAPAERGPYLSPYFNITCYPEDVGFAALVKAVRSSCRTFQLFEIAKAVLEKNDRFVVVIQRKPAPAPAAAPPAPEGAAAAPADPARATKQAPIFMSMPDHLPFETEEAAIQHALKHHLGTFFELAEVEVDPPKGNFPVINKCGITGELIGPPNYHLYQQLLQQHHAAKLPRMGFDRFRESVVSIREPEAVQQWLNQMKRATRYTWKPLPPKSGAPAPGAAPAAPDAAPDEPVAAGSVEAPVAVEPAPAPAVAAPVEALPTFDSFEEARAYLLTNARERVVRGFEQARFHGKLIEQLPPGELRRAIEGHVERQRRFPLDTANALRGRLRREGFSIFKKGSRGVSFVCAVKRRFRVPGQVFSETIAALIAFLERQPLVPVKDLPQQFLGIDLSAVRAAPPPPEAPEGTTASQAPFAALAPEVAERLRKMNNDLRWLVMEGYVTEFSDGRLFAPPPANPQATKKTDEHGEEHDPVDFPEAPAPARAAAPAPSEPSAPAATSPDAAAAAPAAAAPEPTAPEPTAAEPAAESVAPAAESAPPSAPPSELPTAEAPPTEPPAADEPPAAEPTKSEPPTS